MNFEKFIENNYKGLNSLAISDERYMPGVILNNEDRIVDALSNLFPSAPATKWITEKVKTTVSGQTITGSRDLEIGSMILGVVGIKAGVSANYSLSFEFDNATSVVFDNSKGGIYENDVRTLINDLKQNNKDQWRSVLHGYVVMESIIVEIFKIQLSRNGKVITQADLQQYGQEISINGSYSWITNGTMQINNNTNPLGVRGFPIKRFM